jgi:hypothetical protein
MKDELSAGKKSRPSHNQAQSGFATLCSFLRHLGYNTDCAFQRDVHEIVRFFLPQDENRIKT